MTQRLRRFLHGFGINTQVAEQVNTQVNVGISDLAHETP